jgi:hypothetical protein
MDGSRHDGNVPGAVLRSAWMGSLTGSIEHAQHSLDPFLSLDLSMRNACVEHAQGVD